jgi:hypothetical protein
MPRAVMLGEEILGPRISKGEHTNRLTDITRPSRGSDPKTCHAMDQGNTTKRCIKWTKFDIGFKDGRTITGHKVIKQGTTW